jgi:hypothetical protein
MQDPGIADKVIAALRELAGAAGQAVEKLWPMAVKAAWADGFAVLLAGGFVALALGFTLRFMWKLEIPKDSDAEHVRYGISAAVMLFIILTVVTTLNCGLPYVLAPEGKTIFRILGR